METIKSKQAKLLNLLEQSTSSDFEGDEFELVSSYLDSLFESDRLSFVKVLQDSFRFEGYKYAKTLVKAVIFSNIDYLTKEFKNLLEECLQIVEIDYFRELVSMYEGLWTKSWTN